MSPGWWELQWSLPCPRVWEHLCGTLLPQEGAGRAALTSGLRRGRKAEATAAATAFPGRVLCQVPVPHQRPGHTQARQPRSTASAPAQHPPHPAGVQMQTWPPQGGACRHGARGRHGGSPGVQPEPPGRPSVALRQAQACPHLCVLHGTQGCPRGRGGAAAVGHAPCPGVSLTAASGRSVQASPGLRGDGLLCCRPR